MDSLDSLVSRMMRPSWQEAAAVVCAVVAYAVGLAAYRLTLHPLSKFPGPKLAAVTRYYEGYYDVCLGGQYTFKIAEMHKRYGPIVRISPQELHVNDPAFFEVLYRRDAHYDKYDWNVNGFLAPGATVFTKDHHVHRSRRQPLSPYFSKARIAGQQDLIRRYLGKLYRRLDVFAAERATFDLGAATTAFAQDVANDFLMAKDYKSLERDDFNVAIKSAAQGSGAVWQMSKFFPTLGMILKAIPPQWMVGIAPGPMKSFFRHLVKTQDDTRRIMAEAASGTGDAKATETVVHQIINSKLPPSEKEFTRVFEDMTTVAGAAYETTASVLRLLFFFVFSEPSRLRRLRAELAAAGCSPDAPLDLKDLEQLPYLTALLIEGLRLSPGVATRMQRVAPEAGITYEQWHIPAGYPVGMTLIHMHADEKLYPDPHRYNPDRWLDDGVLKRTEFGFAPFSKGTRNCLGMYLAWAEMYICLSDIVQRYDFAFHGASASDYDVVADQFAIGHRGKGVLMATVASH